MRRDESVLAGDRLRLAASSAFDEWARTLPARSRKTLDEPRAPRGAVCLNVETLEAVAHRVSSTSWPEPVARYVDDDPVYDLTTLTDRERAVLEARRDGLSWRVAAKSLGVPYTSIRRMFRAALLKIAPERTAEIGHERQPFEKRRRRVLVVSERGKRISKREQRRAEC